MKIKWLDRRVAKPGPYLCLCLSEEEYLQALRAIRYKETPPTWVSPGAGATTHLFSNPRGDTVTVVCLKEREDRGDGSLVGVEVAGLLVHEAVHVWQDYAEQMGERTPGKEQEAYAIQGIAQELMAEYARRLENATG